MFKAPPVDDISKALRAAARSLIPGTNPWIWPNNIGIALKVFAQALRGSYLRLEWMHRQAFALTSEAQYLDAHGIDVGLTRVPASYAIGSLLVFSDGTVTVPAGAVLRRTDGFEYTTQYDTTGTDLFSIFVKASAPGRTGNAHPATPIEFVNPIAGVEDVVVWDYGIGAGADLENDESFRARILFRKRYPPLGGAPYEYIGWARTMSGVTRVFVQRATPGPGSVTILFMMDDSYPSPGLPLAGDVGVLSYILQSKAPADAEIIVQIPTPVPVDITINGLDPDTVEVRDAVVAEIEAMFRRRAEPGNSAEDFIFSRSWISEAVSMAAGERSHTLVDPAADVACGDGEIAIPGTIEFTDV